MTVVLPSPAVQPRIAAVLVLVFLWNACGTILLVVFPPTTPALLLLCAIVPVAWYWWTRGHLPWPKPSPVISAMMLVSIYLSLNAMWSPSPDVAYRAVGMFWIVTGILYVLLNVIDDIDSAVVRAMALGLVVGMALSGLVLGVEAFTGQGIRRTLTAVLPTLQPDARHIVARPDGTTVYQPYLLNRSIAEFTLLFWPTVMIIDRLGLSKWRVAYLLVVLAPGLAAIVRLEHATSKIALIGSLGLYALFKLSPVFAKRLTVVGWIGAIVLVVPLVSIAFSQHLYLAKWLVPSAQHRIVIWGYTSEQIAKAPLLGAGIAAARAVNEMEKPTAKTVPGTGFQQSTSLHSHNAYLQTWYETGAVGALLLLGLGLLILRALANSQPWAQAYLYAIFTASALLAATGFSIWAPWLLASFAIATIAGAVGDALPAPAHAGQRSGQDSR